MQTEDGRQVCASLLSCLGLTVRYFLALSDDFQRRFRFIEYGNGNGNTVRQQLSEHQTAVHAADVFIYHDPNWMPFIGDDQEPYEELLAQIPPRVKKVSFPLPQLHAFWPFHGPEPRNTAADRPVNRHGQQPCYWYADTHVLKLLKEGVPPEEVISRYLALDVSTLVDLDRLMHLTIAQAERNDETMTVKIADYLASNFRSLRLFQTINHANNRLLLYLTNQVLRELDCAPVDDSVLDRIVELNPLQSPIHPSIARHFNVTWAGPDTRYIVDQPPSRYLTYAEYLREYVYYA